MIRRKRRFPIGYRVTIDGCDYEVRRGTHGTQDHLLLRDRRKITMEGFAFEADFYAENEEYKRLDRPYWKNTGFKHIGLYVRTASRRGWRIAYREMVAKYREQE